MYERLKDHLARPVSSARDVVVRNRPSTYAERSATTWGFYSTQTHFLERARQPFFDDRGFVVLRSLLTFKQANAVYATPANELPLRPGEDAAVRAAWRRLNTVLDTNVPDVTINFAETAAEGALDCEVLGSIAMTAIVALADRHQLRVDQPGLIRRENTMLEPGDALLIRPDAPQLPDFSIHNQSAEAPMHFAILQASILSEKM